jgi:hypothetical protein
MRTSSTSALKWAITAALSLGLLGCGGEQISGSPTGGTGGDGNRGAGGSAVLPGLGFVATSFGFHYPDDPETSVDGFDLDDRVSSMDSPGSAECAHDDFTGPNAEPGIDYNFLRIINNEDVREDGKYVFGGFRQGQLVDGVISGAVKNGSMTILLQVLGLDDPENDDDVRVRIFGSEDSPLQGTDNSVLPGATLSIHPDDHFHSNEAQGAIVDGVLVAGPIDLLFPVEIMIVTGEFLIHDSWLRIELATSARSSVYRRPKTATPRTSPSSSSTPAWPSLRTVTTTPMPRYAPPSASCFSSEGYRPFS